MPGLLECFGDRYVNLQKSGRPTLTRFFVRKSKVKSIEVPRSLPTSLLISNLPRNGSGTESDPCTAMRDPNDPTNPMEGERNQIESRSESYRRLCSTLTRPASTTSQSIRTADYRVHIDSVHTVHTKQREMRHQQKAADTAKLANQRHRLSFRWPFDGAPDWEWFTKRSPTVSPYELAPVANYGVASERASTPLLCSRRGIFFYFV